MKKAVFVLLTFAFAPASAQVYQRIGPDGQVRFSDRPGADAVQVEVRPAQAVAGPPVADQTAAGDQQAPGAAAQQDDARAAYTDFAIVSPVDGEGVRANDGNVTIQLSLQPGLAPGHSIVLRVDGEDGEQTRAADGTRIDLVNLSRGRHIVEARVVDDGGDALIRAGPVRFDVLRVAAGGR